MQLAGTLVPDSGPPTIYTLASTAVSTALRVGRNKKFSITAVDANLTAVPFQVAFGSSTVVGASTSDMFVPGKYVLQTGHGWEYISVYNPTSGNITVYVTLLSNT